MKISDLIKYDSYTHMASAPRLMLMTRNFSTIGKITNFTDWNIDVSANGLHEISFDVHKYSNGIECPVWDDLVDLKIVDVNNVIRFEISVDYNESDENIKSVHGVSLEAELGQLMLNEFHVNDDDVLTLPDELKATSDNWEYDNEEHKWVYVPTVLYDEDNPNISLLNLILRDKAPHWTINHVDEYVAMDDEPETVAELTSHFQRTYSVNGTSIHDFLTGDVAKESNVVFIFDTVNRQINCYCLSDCYDENRQLLQSGIGDDTTILVSKNNLAKEITINSNKDSLKNCFRIEGGDETITNLVRSINMNGSDYIYQFSRLQLEDMPSGLRNVIGLYFEDLEDHKEEYIGDDGIFTKLSKAYEDLIYYQSGMMPNMSISDPFGSAQEQWEDIKDTLNIKPITSESYVIGVSDLRKYSDLSHVGVSNNIEAMANVLVDGRYSAKVIHSESSYEIIQTGDPIYGIWRGIIEITKDDDKTIYPEKDTSGEYPSECYLEIVISDDENGTDLPFTKQKLEKALSSMDMTKVDADCEDMTQQELDAYFSNFCYNLLDAYSKGYDSCLSLLSNNDSLTVDLFNKYVMRYNAVTTNINIRSVQIREIESDIRDLTNKQKKFTNYYNFRNYLGETLYAQFCTYRREDVYSNGNFTSDGLEINEQIKKAQELIEKAEKELKKACVLQRTVDISLENLLLIPEFNAMINGNTLSDAFDLWNYIRLRTDEELIKLRLVGVKFNGENPEDITVTFSDQIESLDGSVSDLSSIMQQAASVATSYDATVLQAKQGEDAKNSVLEIYSKGLDASRAQIMNNDNNEVTITSSGILCKRMDDEGFYGDKQFRITGNIMAFTDDAWRSVKMAIGEIDVDNPLDSQQAPVRAYGIIADTIVGKMLIGETAYIGNENGNVLVTGNGIDIISNDGERKIKFHQNDTNMIEIQRTTNNTLENVLTFDNNGNLSIKGNIEATSGIFNGTVNATGGTFTGDILTTHYITAGNNENYVRLSGQARTLETRSQYSSTEYGQAFLNGTEMQIRRINNGTQVAEGSYGFDGFSINIQGISKDAFSVYSPYNAVQKHTDINIDGGNYVRARSFNTSYSGTPRSFIFMHENPTFTVYVGDADGNIINHPSGKEPLVIDASGYCNINGTAGGIATSSDIRCKSNVSPIFEDKTFEQKYMSLKPVEFEYSYDSKKIRHFGYIANDIQKIFPENKYAIVKNDGKRSIEDKVIDDFLVMDRDEIIALNTAMIQKLYKEVKELKEKSNGE